MANELDRNFLQHFGGVERNSFINILKTDTDINDDEAHSRPQIIEHSQYYDSTNLLPALIENKNGFSILSTNIQSINAKIDHLRISIENLKTQGYEFNAICIQESWLCEDDDVSHLQLEGYHMIPQCCASSSKGGLIIYLQDRYEYEYKSKLRNFDSWEGQIIHVKKGKYLNKSIDLANIYCPPKDLIENYTEFIQEFDIMLKTLEASKNEAIIAGDFNIDLLKLNDKQIFSEYFDMLTSNSFYPKITLPTRLSNNHATLIDNFMCKLTEATLSTISGVLINKFSDHQPYFTILKNIQSKDHPPRYVKITKQNTESVYNFNHEIASSFETNIFLIDTNQDPNINYNKLHNIIEYAKNKHMPIKVVRFNRHKHKKSPWITQGIIHSIQYRDDLYKAHKMTDPTSAEHDRQKNNLKTFNAILKRSVRLSKRNYYETIFNKLKNDIKGTWKTINGILNKTK